MTWNTRFDVTAAGRALVESRQPEEDVPNTPTPADLCEREPARELLPEPTAEELKRWKREDDKARNFCDPARDF